METFKLVVLVLRFIVAELPRIIESMKLAAKDRQYKTATEQIDAALKNLLEVKKTGDHEARRRASRELGK